MKTFLIVLAALASTVPAASQAELIKNGGFETGDFTGWSVDAQTGSGGGLFVVPNTSSGAGPRSGLSYEANPTGSNFFAMTDQNVSADGVASPGSYTLMQSFTLDADSVVSIGFDLFANNYSVGTAAGRDFTVGSPQNTTVDILRGGANAFTDDTFDILSVLYGPGADGGLVNPFTRHGFTQTLGAGTYMIRFAETDTQGFFNMGIDNVSISASAVPEPATWALMMVGLGLVGGAMRRRGHLIATC